MIKMASLLTVETKGFYQMVTYGFLGEISGIVGSNFFEIHFN